MSPARLSTHRVYLLVLSGSLLVGGCCSLAGEQSEGTIAGYSSYVSRFEDEWWETNNSSHQNSSSSGCPKQKSTWVGYVFTAVAVFLFGTCYIATKQVDLGDGMFYQWVFCSAILVSGVVVNGIKKWPEFQPLAMIGGFAFATGNITVVPIVKLIGVGMGMIFWGMVNMIIGWASARYGIIGVSSEPPCSDLLSYLGMLFCILALFMFLFVKSDGSKPAKATRDDERKPLLDSVAATTIQQEEREPILQSVSAHVPGNGEDSQNWADKLMPGARRVFGYVLSVFAGVCYGVQFNPVTHLQQHTNNTAELNDKTAGLRYTFSHFTGVYLASTSYFLVYSLYMRGAPRIYPKAILPGFLSGVMWAIACSSWFVANDLLSQAIAFPIMTTGPAIIASLLGILLYKEITGRRNLTFFMLAFVFTAVGVTLTGLSKVVST